MRITIAAFFGFFALSAAAQAQTQSPVYRALTIPSNPSLLTCPTANCPNPQGVYSAQWTQGNTTGGNVASANKTNEWQSNIGLVVGTGYPDGQKVGQYVGVMQIPGAGSAWAINSDIVRGAYPGGSNSFGGFAGSGFPGDRSDAIAASQTPSGAGALTLRSSPVTLQIPHPVMIYTGGGETGKTVTIVGTGAGGGALTETVTLSTVRIVPTVNNFATVTSASVSAAFAAPMTLGGGNGVASTIGYEFDLTNWSEDDAPGGPFVVGQYIHSQGSYASLAAVYYDSNMAFSANAWHFGQFFSGSTTIQDATIFDATSSSDSYRISGTHTNGINTTGATLTRLIAAAPGQPMCLNILDDCFSYSGGDYVWTNNTNATIATLSDGGAFTVGALNTTGVSTLNGQVSVGTNTSTTAPVILNGAAGSKRRVIIETAGLGAWEFGGDASAQTGSNAGGNFYLQAHNDDGSFGALPLTVSRATGLAAFADGLGVTGGLVADTLAVNGPTTGNNVLYVAPATGASVSAVAGEVNVVNPAATLAALTWTFPSSPNAGDKVKLTSTQAITTLTISAAAGIVGNKSSMAADTTLEYQYVAPMSAWVRTNLAS